jgi:hypothetical protein
LEFVPDLNRALRENPIAAGLIGIGVLWLFVGASKLAALGGAMAGATKSVGGAVGSGASSLRETVGDQIAATSSTIGGAVRHLGDGFGGAQSSGAVRDTAAADYNAASNTIRSSNTQPADSAATLATRSSELFGSLHKKLTSTLEHQPLVLGGIGLAIGAGIGSVFSLTQTESELVGDTGVKIRDSVESFAEETAEAARNTTNEVLKSIRDEAKGAVRNVVGIRCGALSGNMKVSFQAARSIG